MGSRINTNKPDPSRSGTSIYSQSLAGRKSQFTLETGVVTANFLVTAGGAASVAFNAQIWSPAVAINARNISNIISPDNCFIYPETDLFIDQDNDFSSHYWGSINLTSDQQKISVDIFQERTPANYIGSTPSTATTLYMFHNNGSSNHTIYFHGRYKYIVFGNSSL